MIRIADIVIAAVILILCFPLWGIALIASFIDTGSPIFKQKRVGKNQKIFTLYKIRSMKIGTKHLPTHEISRSKISRIGKIIRRLKLDEFPQFINVIKGDMSIVGPRPCLPTQQSVIEARKNRNIFRQKPGITGYAQINGVDMSLPSKLVNYDNKTISVISFREYISLIVLTAVGNGMGDKTKY